VKPVVNLGGVGIESTRLLESVWCRIHDFAIVGMVSNVGGSRDGLGALPLDLGTPSTVGVERGTKTIDAHTAKALTPDKTRENNRFRLSTLETL
jgi:hypothetical protein